MNPSQQWGLICAALLLAVSVQAGLAADARPQATERIRVDGTVNGKRVLLRYDTASNRLVLFADAAKRIGLSARKVQPATATSRSSAHSAELPCTEDCELKLFGLERGSRTHFHLLDSVSSSEVKFDGVLAWNALPPTSIVFDERTQDLTLNADVPPETKNWRKLAIRAGEVLQLEVPDAGGVALFVLADSGSPDGVSLPKARWDELRAARPAQPTTFLTYGDARGGWHVVEEIWVDRLNLGTVEIHDVPVRCSLESDKLEDGFDAVLGVYALFRLNLIADVKNGVAYVNPSPGRGLPYVHNRLGAAFAPAESTGDSLIARVAKESPAERAGLRDGDRLLAIGNLDVTRWRTDKRVLPLSRFFQHRAGTPIDLTIERAGKRHDFQVRLEDILPPAGAPQRN